MPRDVLLRRRPLRNWLVRHFRFERVLNVACGRSHWEGVNADLHCPAADERVDLQSFPWPWQDGRFCAVVIDQYLEHVPQRLDGEDGLIRTLREATRVTRPGGRILIGVPYWRHESMWANPFHYRAFAPSSFDWLRDGSEADLEGRLPLRLVAKAASRRLRLLGLDSSYHLHKWFGWTPNVGPVEGLWFVLEKVRRT